MDELTLLFLISSGLSLVIGSSILIYKKGDRFSFLVGIFTLKPVFSTIWIIGSAFLIQKLVNSLTFGHQLIIYFLPDLLIGIVLVVVLRDVVLESWLAVLVYMIDVVRWLSWLAFLATFTDVIGIIELVELSFHGIVAIVNVGILFLKRMQLGDFEAEPTTS